MYLGHESAFDLLLKEARNPEQAARGNSTLPMICDGEECRKVIMDTTSVADCILFLIRISPKLSVRNIGETITWCLSSMYVFIPRMVPTAGSVIDGII